MEFLKLLKDIWEWSVAVFEHWHGYVSGTIIAFAFEWGEKLKLWEWKPPKKLLVAILSMGFVASIFSAWREEHTKLNELSNPKFSLEIISFMSGSGYDLSDSNVIVIARLTNSGTPSSVKAETWQMAAKPTNGDVYQGIPKEISSEGFHLCTAEEPELTFKRLKSIAQLGHVPKHDDQSTRAWLYGKLFVALLSQKLARVGSTISPWGYYLPETENPQPVA
jgi:hypothetical protein